MFLTDLLESLVLHYALAYCKLKICHVLFQFFHEESYLKIPFGLFLLIPLSYCLIGEVYLFRYVLCPV